MRGGSKTVKQKNIRSLGGKPLLAWSIETALQVSEIDRVIVSTDDEKIAELSVAYGAEVYWRPEELASDSALVIDVIRYMKDVLKTENESAEIMVLLEATCPFRKVEVVKKCLQRLIDENLDSIATFQHAELNPMRTWKMKDGIPVPFIDGAIPWLPKQALPQAYMLNAALYAFRLDKLPMTSPGILFGNMGAEIINGKDIVDIDCEKDFMVANAILESQKNTLVS